MNKHGLASNKAIDLSLQFACPVCGEPHKLTVGERAELWSVGKVVIDCLIYNHWYTIRDDGDGPFVSSH